MTLTARDGRRFESPLVVAADGVHSVIARRLGLNRGWTPRAVALDMMEETPRATLRDIDPSTMWVAYGLRTEAASAERAETGRVKLQKPCEVAGDAPLKGMRTSSRSAIT